MTTRLIKWGAIAAIAYPIMQLTAQGLIQVGGPEPAFTASAQEILEFSKTGTPIFTRLEGISQRFL